MGLTLSVPHLTYLNARIETLHTYLTQPNLTADERYVAAWDLAHSMMSRYYLMRDDDAE